MVHADRVAHAGSKPKVALPRAEKFRDMDTVDLKDYNRQDKDRRYIVYLVDRILRLLRLI